MANQLLEQYKYSQLAIHELNKNLGIARLITRTYGDEYNMEPRRERDIVQIPYIIDTLEAQDFIDGTGTTTQDIAVLPINIPLDKYKEVKVSVTEKEHSLKNPLFIEGIYGKIGYKLAARVEADIFALTDSIGTKVFQTGTIGDPWITGPRAALRKNNVPLNEIYYPIDPDLEAGFLGLDSFKSAYVTGKVPNTVLSQGLIQQVYGINFFLSNNALRTRAGLTSTATASAGTGDNIGAVNGAAIAGATSLVVDGFTDTETLSAGDTFTLAGDPTTYQLTAPLTISGGGGTLQFSPALRRATLDDTVVTFNLLNALEEDTHYVTTMFHRDAFALVVAPLTNPAGTVPPGINRAQPFDTETGMTMTLDGFYDATTRAYFYAGAILYGAVVLDPQKAVTVIRGSISV